jgi:hypothetical protein
MKAYDACMEKDAAKRPQSLIRVQKEYRVRSADLSSSSDQ